MAMTDDERIIEALAKARAASNQINWDVSGESCRLFARNRAAQQLAALRKMGGDVTLPPAPEPTYQADPFTMHERNLVSWAIRRYIDDNCILTDAQHTSMLSAYDKITKSRRVNPEPGA